MKARIVIIMALLVAALGGAKAAGTYTINISQGYTLLSNDEIMLTALVTEQAITLEDSGNDKVVKKKSDGTHLFSYNTSTKKCSLPAATSSANNMTQAIVVSQYQLSLLGLNYSNIALNFPDPVAYASYSGTTLTFRYDHQIGHAPKADKAEWSRSASAA